MDEPSSAGAEIVVVGSVNLDLVVRVETLPHAGETVLATGYHEFVGGKGGNQAVAAARLGRRVAFVGHVGTDQAASTVRSALADEGVDVTLLTPVDGPTGRAFVQVDDEAENQIIVVGGANGALSEADVAAAAPLLTGSPVVVAQLEVPLEAVVAAGRRTSGVFVLNPAPAQELPRELLALVDVLVVNEGEFEVVTGAPVSEEALTSSSLPERVVVTLGGRGALVRDGASVLSVGAPRVEVVDTTGAGDTFVGALAAALARDVPYADAVRWAVGAASLSTQALGATSGMPSAAEVDRLMSTSGS
ncbi:ribokinase [Nocardioides marmoribigeumensis]|uniref:Ribokinase n=1 Tax=Nocardioides marmoribigeumensis TaxID=433649 RepID=A0ABU2BQ93_9ACTN|nr:ribokinase [Nocardioides marmoribigeumensis]MDR7360805.1 ribokinase [Nocardioides marmoribigeumensis]